MLILTIMPTKEVLANVVLVSLKGRQAAARQGFSMYIHSYNKLVVTLVTPVKSHAQEVLATMEAVFNKRADVLPVCF
jgi:hypothetical protein